MTMHATALLLFESSDTIAVQQDPANEDWVALVGVIDGERFERIARRYYEALYHFRKEVCRPAMPGQLEIVAPDRQGAMQGLLAGLEQRKAHRKAENVEQQGQAAEVFVDPVPNVKDESLPASLRDFTHPPLPLGVTLGGRGRPPCDALCLLRAFLVAPLLGVGDGPTSVFRLLRSNPTFAHLCGFLGRDVCKESGALTSRRLPSRATCEEFSEVMTRYGLWHLARLDQVRDNLASGVVQREDTAAFDTTHVIANSHCANVVPIDAKVEDGKKPKHRKVPRMCKRCTCGQQHWDSCDHPWVPTDQGAAVVVKGPTRVYWAHKASVMSLGDSETPIDVKVCCYR